MDEFILIFLIQKIGVNSNEKKGKIEIWWLKHHHQNQQNSRSRERAHTLNP